MKIILIGRKGCKYSIKIKKFLLKKKIKLFYYETNKIGEKFEKKIPYKSILISFRNTAILKKELLDKTYYAINFHAATNKYRGIGAPNFALLKNEKNFGSTAHLIDEKIDHGKIIEVKKFKILSSDNLVSLLRKTHKIMYLQALRIINGILANKNYIESKIDKNNKVKWSKNIYTYKKMLELYEINPPYNLKKIYKIFRATAYKKFYPYIIKKNKKIFIKNKRYINKYLWG
jgi:methionyl-tRNA formyltransferase